MELIKVLNENGQETGQILDRNIVHKKGLWHREVAVWVFNNKGEILIQRRSEDKKVCPNKLSICAGHIESKNDSITTAQIELQEEIGISKELKNIFYLLTEKKEKEFNKNLINRIFSDVYYIIENRDISKFTIQKEELSEVFWIDYLDFKKKIMDKDNEISITYTPKKFELLDKIYSKITQ